MINSRKVEDLHPKVADLCRQFLSRCNEAGIDVLITSTYRDHESQNALYAVGRTVKGANVTAKNPMGDKVTNAKGGQSFHQWRVAFDVVPLRNGKPVWGTDGEDGKLWQKVGEIGESVGLKWAGRWVSFRELAHFQYTGGLTLADLQAGKTLAA